MPTQKQFLDHTGLTELLDELGQYLKSKLDKDFIINLRFLVPEEGQQLGVTGDKTFSEITAAVNAGKNVYAVYSDSESGTRVVFEFESMNSTTILFVVTIVDGLYLVVWHLEVNSNDNWNLITKQVQEQLESGTTIKTINNQSLLGSGNVDVTEFTELTAEEGLMLWSKMMGVTISDQTAFNAMCEKINAGLSAGKQIRGVITTNDNVTFAIISVNGVRNNATNFMLMIYSTLWEYTRYLAHFSVDNGDWKVSGTQYISLNNHNIGENIRYEYDYTTDQHIFSAVDEKVAQTASSENVDIPLLLASGATPGTAGAKYDADFKFNPSTNTLKVGTGTLTATNYSGNAATATSDSLGNNISETYATKSEVEDNELVIARSLTELHDTKQELLTFDNTPTANSGNPVTSEGIKKALDDKQDKMVVMFRQVEGDTLSCDKSIADIYTAVSAGTEVVGLASDSTLLAVARVSVADSDFCVFDMQYGGLYTNLIGSVVNGTDVWQREQYLRLISDDLVTRWNNKQDALVSGTNIKTVAGNSLLGSGNVTLNDSDIYHSGEDGEDGNYIDDGDTVDVCLNNLDTAVANKQNTLVSGTNIKTVNNNSLLGSGDVQVGDITGEELETEIEELESTLLTDALRKSEQVLLPAEKTQVLTNLGIADVAKESNLKTVNGASLVGTGNIEIVSVNAGDINVMQGTGDSQTNVMSQKAVTEYGRKVTVEDLNGTSLWVREKLTAEGWEFGKIVATNGTVGGVSNWMCVSPMFPCSTNHSFLFQPKKTNNPGNCMLAFYNGSDAFKGSIYVAIIDATQTYTPTDSTITQLRFSCNMNDLPNVFVKDITTDEYIFKGDEVIKNLITDSENVVSYSVLEDSIIKQTTGRSSISLMSQRAITDAIARQNGFEASEGMATINYNDVYTKLTQRQVERLNSAEVATFHILAKPIKSHASGMFGASFFVSKDSLGYRIYQSSGSIVVNGITIATYNTIGMFPVSRYFVCDRVNGVVSLYTGTKLLAKVQNDSFKKDKFIGDDGIFSFNSGYYKAVFYEMKIFDFDVFSLSYNDTIFNYNLRDAEVATMNTDSVKNAFNLFDTTVYTKNKPTVATNNAQYSRTTDSEGYSTISVSPTATTTCMLQQNPHWFDTSRGNVYNYGQYMVKEIIFDLEVISGNINLATNTTGEPLEIKRVIDENGNIIDDASNCGTGIYHIHIITSSADTGIIKSAGVSCVFRLLSASVKMLCCVAHLSFNKWYNGEIYDDEADTYYHLYSDSSLSKEPTNVVLSPEPARRNGTLKLTYPQFIGQIAITSSGIFMGNRDYVWKQINNS